MNLIHLKVCGSQIKPEMVTNLPCGICRPFLTGIRHRFKSDKVAEVSYASRFTILGKRRDISPKYSNPRQGLFGSKISQFICDAGTPAL